MGAATALALVALSQSIAVAQSTAPVGTAGSTSSAQGAGAGGQAGGEGTPVAPQDAPFITPSVDADVLYELTSPTGDTVMKQRMRWQVGTLRQRLDPDGSNLFMITSWPQHTLTVVDPDRKTESVMPAPSQGLTPPGHPAMVGTYARLGGSVVAGEHCIIWRTRDADGHASDVCYTADGLLLQVAQQGQITVRALRVSRVAQPDAVFAIPSGLKKEAPVKP
ncbi:hypothetical protein AA0473_1277 [Acetobacter orleanensis NRIC 0473]|uniref:DUF4412 domain-containing protein n=2 Tax=Acetobacter orleanensis TaxID=104099 RepID=A0A4Y3TKE1_9PROT|nr:hypothetical protein Abol_014_198 [Acetobacter orleanensis JCM 7639]GBR26906.1 hypothetical protein AA0473_1277 [Acetobacter orleanensis NRIC 0473]GEB81929.1 hypothetical protein AOR01nite_04060 [Acetobacter orleanensis]